MPSNPPGSNNGILYGRLEAENDGWIGLGISPNGKMVGSEAIVGVPDDDSVMKFELNGKSTSRVDPMPDDKQTLRDVYVREEDGMTIAIYKATG